MSLPKRLSATLPLVTMFAFGALAMASPSGRHGNATADSTPPHIVISYPTATVSQVCPDNLWMSECKTHLDVATRETLAEFLAAREDDV